MLMKSSQEFLSEISESIIFAKLNFNSRASAMSFEFLEHVGVSSVLNAAEGTKPGCVGTNQVQALSLGISSSSSAGLLQFSQYSLLGAQDV